MLALPAPLELFVSGFAVGMLSLAAWQRYAAQPSRGLKRLAWGLTLTSAALIFLPAYLMPLARLGIEG